MEFTPHDIPVERQHSIAKFNQSRKPARMRFNGPFSPGCSAGIFICRALMRSSTLPASVSMFTSDDSTLFFSGFVTNKYCLSSF